MLKNLYQTEDEIPENLRGAYFAKNGRYELDTLSDDHPAIKAKNSLESTQSTLKNELQTERDKNTRLGARELPDGTVPVTPEVEKLGLAALDAGLKQTEMKDLKPKISELTNKLTETERFERIGKAAKLAGKNARFELMAKDKNLDFEFITEGDDKKEAVYVKGLAENERTKLDDFIKNDAYFSEFAETFTGGEGEGFQWGRQEAGQERAGANIYDQERAKVAEKQKAQKAAETDSLLTPLGSITQN